MHRVYRRLRLVGVLLDTGAVRAARVIVASTPAGGAAIAAATIGGAAAVALHAAAQAAADGPQDLHEERGSPVVLEEEGVPFLQAAARANDFHPHLRNMKPKGVKSVATQEGPL